MLPLLYGQEHVCPVSTAFQTVHDPVRSITQSNDAANLSGIKVSQLQVNFHDP